MDPSQQVQGLPPGAIVGPPLTASAPATPAGSPSVAPQGQIQGLPPGAVVGPPLQQQAAPQPTSDQEFSLGNVAKGAGQEALGMAQGAATQVFPGQNDLVDSIHELPAVYKAYEMARQQGKGMWDAVAAADAEASKQEDARNVIKQRVAEFTTNPDIATGKLLMDAVAVLAGAKGFKGATAGAGEAAAEGGAAEAAGATGTPKAPGIVSQVLKGEKVAQPAAEAALRGGVEAGAKEGGVSTVQPKSIRSSLEDPIQTLHASAKDLYHQVDTAAGTDFKALYEKLDNTETEIRSLTDTEEDVAKEAKLEKARTGLLDKIEDAKQQAKANGVDPKLLDQADAQFKQKSAMQDVETRVFKNPNVIEGNAQYGSPEMIKLDAATKALQRLKDTTKYGGSRLEQAFGKEGADNLLKNMYEAQRNGMRAASRQQIAKWVAKAAGVGGLAITGAERIFGQ